MHFKAFYVLYCVGFWLLPFSALTVYLSTCLFSIFCPCVYFSFLEPAPWFFFHLVSLAPWHTAFLQTGSCFYEEVPSTAANRTVSWSIWQTVFTSFSLLITCFQNFKLSRNIGNLTDKLQNIMVVQKKKNAKTSKYWVTNMFHPVFCSYLISDVLWV